MARKVDSGAGSDELRLPYESDVLAALEYAAAAVSERELPTPAA